MKLTELEIEEGFVVDKVATEGEIRQRIIEMFLLVMSYIWESPKPVLLMLWKCLSRKDMRCLIAFLSSSLELDIIPIFECWLSLELLGKTSWGIAIKFGSSIMYILKMADRPCVKLILQ